MDWKLTRSLMGEPEIVVLDDEDLTFGYSLLRELARQDRSMHRLDDGVYLVEKTHPTREV